MFQENFITQSIILNSDLVNVQRYKKMDQNMQSFEINSGVLLGGNYYTKSMANIASQVLLILHFHFHIFANEKDAHTLPVKTARSS